MARKVFISYRRVDASYPADRIYRAFAAELGPDGVFIDVDSIPPGRNFRRILKGWVDGCEILLAVIGPHWIDVTDPRTGRRRLDDPDDFVRIEIGEALARDIDVVPVLLDGTPMPDRGRLPDDLKELADRQAALVERRTFDADVARLIRQLGLEGGSGPAPSAKEERYRAEGRIKVDCPAGLVHGAPDGWLLPGAGKTEWFQDIAGGPEMVVVPAGSFTMGSPANEPERFDDEGPQHRVEIERAFAVSRHAVTRGQFAAFVKATGHKAEGAHVWKGDKWDFDANGSWRNPGFPQDDGHPAVCVNWDDAQAYVGWLAQATGKPYRLLSEAEWEYCCRAGKQGGGEPFWWGSSITPAQANYDCNSVYAGGGSKGEWRKGTVPVGSFAANDWGLYQVHGNVWAWCEDVWHDNYEGAPPTDGSAWLQGGDASRRVVRGGSWDDYPRYLRSACRIRFTAGDRGSQLGFRLARTL